jgi:hypothetical protein
MQTGPANLATVGVPTEAGAAPVSNRAAGTTFAPEAQRTNAAVSEKLGKSALQGSGVDRRAFSKNAAAPSANNAADAKTAKTGIAAVDSGLSKTVADIQKRRAKGAEGVSLGSDQADLDRLFEQIGSRRRGDFNDLTGKDGAVSLEGVSADPKEAVAQLAGHAVRSVAEAKAALAAGDKALALQRVSDAGEFFDHTSRVAEANGISGASVDSSFSKMRRSAAEIGPEAVRLLRDAAIESAVQVNKERAVDYANGLAAWNSLLTDTRGRAYAADYDGFLAAFKTGLKRTLSRTLAGEKLAFESADVETFSGRSNPRVRIRLPKDFISIAALDEAALVNGFKLAPDAIVALDEQLALAGEGLAMHAAMKFDLRTQGFFDLKRKADAELAKRKLSNPFGLRGFFIAARRYLGESFSKLWAWILSVLQRFGIVSGMDLPAIAGTVVSTENVAALRTREAKTYPRPERLPAADRLGFSVLLLH